MKIRILAAAALAAGLATSAFAQQPMSAQEFAAMAASSDMFEIRSSELALQKAKDDAVTGFAQMMVNDHTAASEKLKAAAAEANVTVPAELNDKHAAQLEELEGLSDAEFEAKYIDAQVAAHQEALTLMQTYASNGDSEPLKEHAEATAPVIEMHFEHVKKVDAEM